MCLSMPQFMICLCSHNIKYWKLGTLLVLSIMLYITLIKLVNFTKVNHIKILFSAKFWGCIICYQWYFSHFFFNFHSCHKSRDSLLAFISLRINLFSSILTSTSRMTLTWISRTFLTMSTLFKIRVQNIKQCKIIKHSVSIMYWNMNNMREIQHS